jgi:hypothetical protein
MPQNPFIIKTQAQTESVSGGGNQRVNLHTQPHAWCSLTQGCWCVSHDSANKEGRVLPSAMSPVITSFQGRKRPSGPLPHLAPAAQGIGGRRSIKGDPSGRTTKETSHAGVPYHLPPRCPIPPGGTNCPSVPYHLADAPKGHKDLRGRGLGAVTSEVPAAPTLVTQALSPIFLLLSVGQNRRLDLGLLALIWNAGRRGA